MFSPIFKIDSNLEHVSPLISILIDVSSKLFRGTKSIV